TSSLLGRQLEHQRSQRRDRDRPSLGSGLVPGDRIEIAPHRRNRLLIGMASQPFHDRQMAYTQPEDEAIAVERPQRVEPLSGREGVAGVDARDRAAELEPCGLAKSKPRDRQRLEATRLRIPEGLITQPL